MLNAWDLWALSSNLNHTRNWSENWFSGYLKHALSVSEIHLAVHVARSFSSHDQLLHMAYWQNILHLISGSWPTVSCPGDYEFQPGKCKLRILNTCRHHITDLKCCLAEESLCSLPSSCSLSFPGPFLNIQFVVALGSDKEELFDCQLEASRIGKYFKIVS